MVRYAGLSIDEAFARLMKSTIITDPPATYADVTLLTHEYEYHWAMALAYGANYWLGDLGVSHDTGKFFDEGWVSDFDIALADKDLYEKATSAGLTKGNGSRVQPIDSDELADMMGLKPMRDRAIAQKTKLAIFRRWM